jgi:anti-sigma B factor antagonist
MTRQVEVRAAIQGSSTVVTQLSGDLAFDCVGAVELRLRALIHAGLRHLILDVSELEFCDSSGLGLLLRLRAEVAEDAGQLELRGLSGQPARLLRMTGADQILLGQLAGETGQRRDSGLSTSRAI